MTGETGTGKDLAAHAIHQKSSQSEAPLVVVNCGSIPENLIESELFGHVVGAFTGATNDRMGAFEQAQGGTILLDEIGEIPLQLQSRFLRVLDTRKIQRVGSHNEIALDLRIIAATHRDLRRQVNEGLFREDLYHRLAIITTLPIRIARSRWTAQFESQYLESLMREEGGNVSAVARRAGVNRVHMNRLNSLSSCVP